MHLGKVATVTNPYRTTGDETYGTTQFSYDALDRETQVTNPDGSTVQMSYTGGATEMSDGGNGTSRVQTIYQKDSLGRLVGVCEITGASQLGSGNVPGACNFDISGTGFLTSYGYDALGDLTSVTQSGLNGRSYSYDMLSRLTNEINPESGTTTYRYDSCSAGDLCTRTRPKPNQTSPSVTVATSYAYDPLHRLSTVTYSDGTPTVKFGYDETSPWGKASSNAKGYLTSAQVDDSSTGSLIAGEGYITRDAMGRVLWALQNNSTSEYDLTYGYDLLGDETSLYDSEEGVTYSYSYDAAGRLSEFQSSLIDSAHPGTLYTVNQYNPLGEVQRGTFGNGIVRNVHYDDRGRVTSLTDGSIYSYALGFAPDSNILTGNDSVNGNWTYTYDDFSRIASSSKSGQAFNYKYDRFGNRWQQNVTTGSGPSPSYSLDANNHLVGFSYDAAGNLLNDGSHNYTYDAEGRLLTVDTTAASYVYDAAGQRVQATVGATPYDFIFDQAGQALTVATASSWVRSDLYAGTMHVASYANGATYFDHSDWLGTVRAWTGVSGSSVGTCASLAYGDGQSCSGTIPSPLQFTGQPLDAESNLTHFPFRQLSTTQGRWMTPDPAGAQAANPSDPQTWNRYAYVGNNPMGFTDSGGLKRDLAPEPSFGWYISALDAFGLDGDCTMDGLDTPCDLVYATLQSGGALVCPYNNCGLVNKTFQGTNGRGYTLVGGVNGWVWINDANGAEIDDVAELGLPDFGSGPPADPFMAGVAANNGPSGGTGGCGAKILSAVNSHFGTSIPSADVGTGKYAPFPWPQVSGGTINIDVFPGPGQADGISPGRYPVNWWTYAIGYGSTLHIPAGPGGLDSPSTLFFSSSQFTAHLDSAYPYNPIGLLVHGVKDVLGVGGHSPCP